ncbi:hypothetical protein J1N35_043589 [Gossypium stocksii]|uniref:Uncharacterized protein n=1 Tax=Gossypium stocksii TaxID=47602 RepID=A0A9D3ZF75_9ROSI|nr:hypothetical protein J1N35_043589 [Gossypium stocksii]
MISQSLSLIKKGFSLHLKTNHPPCPATAFPSLYFFSSSSSFFDPPPKLHQQEITAHGNVLHVFNLESTNSDISYHPRPNRMKLIQDMVWRRDLSPQGQTLFTTK